MLGALVQQAIIQIYQMTHGDPKNFSEKHQLFILGDGTVVFAQMQDEELSEAFRGTLSLALKQLGAKAVYAERPNFEGMSGDEASEYLNPILRDRIEELNIEMMIQCTPAVLDAAVPGVNQDSEDGRAVIQALTSIPHLCNVAIQFDDKLYLNLDAGEEGEAGFEITEDSKKEPKKLATSLSGRPDRETVINDDDLLNIQIAFGSAKSFEELLELL